MLFIPVFPSIQKDTTPVLGEGESTVVTRPELTNNELQEQYKNNMQHIVFIERIISSAATDTTVQMHIEQVKDFTMTFYNDFTQRLLQFDDLTSLVAPAELIGNTVVFRNVAFFDYDDIIKDSNYYKLVQTYTSIIYRALVADQFLESKPTASIRELIEYIDSNYRTIFVETKPSSPASYFKDNVFGIKDFIETIMENAVVRIPYIPVTISNLISDALSNHRTNGFDVKHLLYHYMRDYYGVNDLQDNINAAMRDPNNELAYSLPIALSIFQYANMLLGHLLQNPRDIEKCKTLAGLFTNIILSFTRSDYKRFLFETDETIQSLEAGEASVVHIAGNKNYFIIIGHPDSLSSYKDVLLSHALYDFNRIELKYLLK